MCAALFAIASLIWAVGPGEASTIVANPIYAANDQGGGDEKSKGGGESNKGDKENGGGEGKADAQNGGGDKEKKKTPEEKMQARFPQPVKVGHLLGLPVLDDKDSTIGYVERVVRTPQDKIQLIVPYGKRFGWLRKNALFGGSRRLVAVPIEVVAILALHINAVDMDRPSFDKAPTWVDGQARPIPADEMIKIALGRR